MKPTLWVLASVCASLSATAGAQPRPAPPRGPGVYRFDSAQGSVSLGLGRDRAVVAFHSAQGDEVYVANVVTAPEGLRLVGRGASARLAADAPLGLLVRRGAGVELRVEADAVQGGRRAVTLAEVANRGFSAPLSAAGHDDQLVLASRLGDCGPLDVREGGNRVVCASGLVLQVGSVPTATLEVRASGTERPTTQCADYLGRAGFVSLDLAPGVTLCDATTGPLTARASIDAVARSFRGLCQREANRGGTHLVCGGRRFSFAGPQLALSRVSAETPAPRR
ncbi:MAG: hypothetical protein JNK72_20050 [Myxococcales bacterium]|nr:hypothetical protein [Myxococcales bacterium]